MEHFRKVTKQVESKEHIKTTCDLCSKPIKDPPGYEDDEIEIKHRHGSNYPDGGWGKELKVDCCRKCWDEKVLPALNSFGLTRQYEDWEW